MTDTELKTLKDNLWHSADMLRSSAHLAANKYGQPILGLIFLRYADILFKQHKEEIDAEYNKYKGTRMEKHIKMWSLANVVSTYLNVPSMVQSTMLLTMQRKLC